MEGWCKVFRKEEHGKVWSKLWVVVEPGLLTYSPTQKQKSRRTIDLTHPGIEALADESRAAKYQFELRGTKRGTVYLRAIEEDDVDKWCKALNDCRSKDASPTSGDDDEEAEQMDGSGSGSGSEGGDDDGSDGSDWE